MWQALEGKMLAAKKVCIIASLNINLNANQTPKRMQRNSVECMCECIRTSFKKVIIAAAYDPISLVWKCKYVGWCGWVAHALRKHHWKINNALKWFWNCGNAKQLLCLQEHAFCYYCLSFGSALDGRYFKSTAFHSSTKCLFLFQVGWNGRNASTKASLHNWNSVVHLS